MLDYVKRLVQMWGNDAPKLLIIKVGICAHLILAALGIGLKAPFAICVRDENVVWAVFRELSGFNPLELIPLGLSRKEFEDRMIKADYEVFPIFCNSVGEKNRVNLEIAGNAMISRRIKTNYFYNLPVVVFCGSVPQDLTGYLSGKCVIDGKGSGIANNENAVRDIIDALYDSMPFIENKLRDSNVGFLRGAGEVCKVLLEREEGANIELRTELIQNIEQAIADMEDEWEIALDCSGWIELLKDSILKRAKWIIRIVNRKAVSYEDELLLERYPMYDDDFYYFTREFFSELCKKIPYITELEMKRAMRDAGILVGEGGNRSYFEVKVPIKTVSGVKVARRRLRVKRSWLDLPGKLTWRDQIEMNRRNNR